MSNYKILISDAVADDCLGILRERGFEFEYRPGISKDELLGIIAEFHALIVRSATKVTADVIDKGSNLKVIGRAGTGVDNIDIPAATGRGIVVVNCLGANTLSAAEHTFALAMALARHIPAAHISLLEKKWERGKFKGRELSGKTYGILGLGKIGLEIAQRAQAFNMSVIAFDPLIENEMFKSAGVEQCSLEELLRRSDFLSIHVPLLPATKHLIGAAQFELCKKSLCLINTSRGGIVDEDALYEALRKEKIGGAALDVFEKEPPFDSPLLDLPNMILTPHLGASTFEAQQRVAEQIAVRVADFLEKGETVDIVNPEVLDNA